MGCKNSKIKYNNEFKIVRYIDKYIPKNLENYMFTCELRDGKFCQTYLFKSDGTIKTNEIIVLKRLKMKESKYINYYNKEIELVKLLSIIPTCNIVMGRVLDNVIIMEYCEKGDLYDILKKEGTLDEILVTKYLKGIIRGLNHINGLGYIHRDIKLENILVTKHDVVKICDFNLCDIGTDISIRDSSIGTVTYRAPEVYNTVIYGKECDIWSLGTLLYILLTNKYPFMERDNEPNYNSVINERKIWNKVSYRMRILIGKMLKYTPEERITLDEILEIGWLK